MMCEKVSMAPEGPQISQLIAGLWRLRHWNMQPQEVLAFVEQCVELGVTTMDHAMVYRSEEPFGQALSLKPGIRDDIEIVTKCGIRPQGFGELGAQDVNHYDSSKTAILQSVDASLKALQTDYVDVLLLHRPDYLMNADEVVEAFDQLKAQGKVKYFGVSNFNVHQFEYLRSMWPGLVTNQVELSPYYKEGLESGVFEQCAGLRIRPMLWSCLAGGAVFAPDDLKGERILKTLQSLQEKYSLDSIEPIIYAWVMALPCKPLPILGTRRIDRVKTALQALAVNLTKEDWYSIWEASNGHSVP